ncbi:MAG: group 1 truncated hemoglobin [Pseudobdellovibrio sp.]
MNLSDAELYNIVLKINQGFYDRVYKDPWLSQVFRKVEQKNIESQQTDFMVGALGGPEVYRGRSPKDAHPHIFVNEEMWLLREKFLVEAFVELKIPEWLREKWLRIDNAFKAKILKKSFEDCQKRYFSDEIIYEPSGLKQRKIG